MATAVRPGDRRRRRSSIPPVTWERVGPYRLCYELAQGGMGAVYLARDDRQSGAGRFVALKRMLSEHHQADELRAMFGDEAQIAARIRHPHVCSVLDFDAAAEIPYLVMELLHGHTLTRLFSELHRLGDALAPLRRAALAARIVADACEGLHCAHELRDDDGHPLGVVHRDVSLDNLLLTYDGAVKVIDFGVVRAARKIHRTQTGMLKGKYAYIAPELLQGDVADRRADVWGLGIVLWELVTHRRLFRRTTELETLNAVAKMNIPPPSTLCKKLPTELDAIVMAALARDPNNRFRTARELSRALTQFCALYGEAAGMADLADLMQVLFPGGRAAHESLIRSAAQLDDSEARRLCRTSIQPEFATCSLPPAALSDPPSNSSSVSSSEVRVRPARKSSIPPALTPRSFRSPSRRPTLSRMRPFPILLPPPRPRRSFLRSRLALALAAAVVTATAVGAVYARRGDVPGQHPSQDASSTAATPAR